MSTPTGTLGYRAPEIFRNEEYDKSVDCWALGVIAFISLCGFPPFFSNQEFRENECMLLNAPFWVFFNENTTDLRDDILRGNVQFPEPYWSAISVEAKDFVRQLLNINPQQRMTAEQALKHLWLTKDFSSLPCSTSLQATLSMMSNLKPQLRNVSAILKRRPTPQQLIDSNILKSSPKTISRKLQAVQQRLQIESSKDRLRQMLRRRPSIEKLIEDHIMLAPE